MKPLEDLKHHIPLLRRYVRALVCHLVEPDTSADELVQATLFKTLEMGAAVRGDLSIHLYNLLTQLHRDALRSGKTAAKEASKKNQPSYDFFERDPKPASNQNPNRNASAKRFIQDYSSHGSSLPWSLAPLLKIKPRESEPPKPSLAAAPMRSAGTQFGHADVQAKPHRAAQGPGTSGKFGAFETQRERAVKALNSLALDEKEAYLLVVLEGFDYASAAKVLRISKTKLVDRLAHARLALGATDFLTPEPKTRHVPHLVLVK